MVRRRYMTTIKQYDVYSYMILSSIIFVTYDETCIILSIVLMHSNVFSWTKRIEHHHAVYWDILLWHINGNDTCQMFTRIANEDIGCLEALNCIRQNSFNDFHIAHDVTGYHQPILVIVSKHTKSFRFNIILN